MSDKGRIVGLDAARAVALFGMFAAHVGDPGGRGWWRWLVVAHGRSSALFTLLAGVSIALMLSHAAQRFPPMREAVRHTRVRVAVRAGVLIALGWLLQALRTPVDIILDNLGVMFLLVLAALRWRPSALLAAGCAVLACGSAVLLPIADAVPSWLHDLPVVHELWSPHYPALAWVGYVLVGLGIGRLAPWRGAPLGLLVASGLVLTVLGYGTGLSLKAAFGERAWYSVRPHSYSAFEMFGNVGVALTVVAVCCWLAPRLPRVVWPLAAAGSMTLTLYTAQVVVIAIAGPGIVYSPANAVWLGLCAASLAFACLWKWRMGQGPLESVLSAASTAVADARTRVGGAA